MKELLYFSFSDLMVRVEYCKDANSLRYSTHRKISTDERIIIEQYLLSNVATKTDYYKKYPALLIYLGINNKLIKDLNLFHLKNTLMYLNDKEKDIKESVKNLIDQSMTNYYFDKIGDTILEMKETLKKIRSDKDLRYYTGYYKNQFQQLINAYNHYSGKNLVLNEILPEELKEYFEMIEI